MGLHAGRGGVSERAPPAVPGKAPEEGPLTAPASGPARVVVVAGPTASGKSALALDIAEAFRGTVINADSMQVYRELPILTAAPDRARQARVPHRLYGVIPVGEACSAGRWRGLALAEIAAARAAGRLPVVVGGSGLYLRALMTGLARIPPVPAALRGALRARLERCGAAALHAELAVRDPVMAARLGPGDGQRIARALEVLEATGRSLADWQRPRSGPGGAPELRFLTLLLMPPRESLYAACDARFKAMVAGGAVAEARALGTAGLDARLPAMKAVGLRELLRHAAGDITREEAVRLGQQATRRYAKRQMTWFRHQMTPDHIISEQYSETFKPKIFSYISKFLLTSPP